MRDKKLFIKAFCKKSGYGLAIIAVFLFLSALLMNTFCILSYDFKDNFVRWHDRLNAEHNIFVISADDTTALRKSADGYFSSDENVAGFESSCVFAVSGSIAYDGETLETKFVGLDRSSADSKRIGRFEIYEEDESISGVLLPYVFYASGNYSTGDDFTLNATQGSFTSKVRGFYISAMDSSINCVMIALIYDDGVYDAAKTVFASDALMYSIRLCDPDGSSGYMAKVSNRIYSVYSGAEIMFSNCYSSTSSARYIVATICTAIISVAVVVSVVVMVTIITFNISGYISDNIKMFGTLKALGYVSAKIMNPFLLLFAAGAVIFGILGIAGSYLIMPLINSVLTAQTGIPYNIRIILLPGIISVALLFVFATGSALVSLLRVKRIQPVNAIRDPRQSAKKTKYTLKKSRMPVDLAVSFNAFLGNVKQNAIIALTLLLVSLLSVFSVALLDDVIINDTAVAYLVFGEFCDSAIVVSNSEYESLHSRLEADSRVTNVLDYYTQEMVNDESGILTVKVIDDGANITNRNYCYEGRLPRDGSEVALGGTYASDRGFSIGDSISFSLYGHTESFTVCGFVQSADTLGSEAVMLKEAYEKFAQLPYRILYVNVTADTDIDAFNAELEKDCAWLYTSNKQSYLKSMENSFFGAIKLVCAAVLAVSFCIVLLVLFVLNRSLLDRKMKDFGIMKALGYSSGRLILQSVLTYLPVVLVSTAAGIVLSCFAVNPLITVFMSGIGIHKCAFEIPVAGVIACGGGIVLASVTCTLIISLKTKNINVRRLLNRE